MKTIKHKGNQIALESGNYLEQACLEGLSKKQKDWAKDEIKKFEFFGKFVGHKNTPYGLIRHFAKQKFKDIV